MKRYHTLTAVVAILALSKLLTLSAGATLVAQYTFDSATGDTVADVSGNGHVATFSTISPSAPTAPTLSTDNPLGQPGNKSLSLDGNTRATLSGAIALNNNALNQFTIEAWVKPATYQNMYAFTAVSTAPDNSATFWYFGMNGNGQAYAAINNYTDSTLYSVHGSAALSLTQWTLLDLVSDGAYLRLYQDGVQVGTPVAFPEILSATFQDGAAFISSTAGVQAWNGLVDDLSIDNTDIFVPEPSSLALLGLGGLLVLRRRRCWQVQR